MFTIVISTEAEFSSVRRSVRSVATVAEMLEAVHAARADEYTVSVSVRLAGKPYPV